jgi:hypothetical protein
MAALPNRNDIAGTPSPSNATAKAGFGAVWDFLDGLFGSTGVAADARSELSVPSKNEIQAQTLTAYTTSGTGSVFTLTPVPALTAYTANQRFVATLNADPSGSPTMNWNALGAKDFKYYDSTGTKQFVTTSQAKSGYPCDVMYDGTDIVLLNPLPGAGQVDSPFKLTAVPNGSNAMVLALKAGGWWFRNPTLGTGEFEYVSTASDLTLTISSGSTLGGTNGVQMDIVARVVNDAGTLRLTAENRAGGMDVSEMGVISTTAEGGSGGADSATTIYSGTAVTSKAYRTAGIIRSTQATAGTWATAPSLIQGVEGQALISRAGPMTDTTVSIGTTYTSTNKDALYTFVGTGQNGALCQIGITINGVGPKMFAQAYAGASATGYWNGSVLIPANARFTLSAIAGSPSSTVSTFYQELN